MIFLDTINVVNVKLCMMVLLIELYSFISYHFQSPWIYFKVREVQTVLTDFFYVLIQCNGDNWHIFSFEKKTTTNICFFSDAMKVRSFKLCMIKTLDLVYSDILCSVTYVVPRSQVCQRHNLQIVFLTQVKNVSLCNDQCWAVQLAGQPSGEALKQRCNFFQAPLMWKK